MSRPQLDRAARDARIEALHQQLATSVSALVSGEDWRRALELGDRQRPLVRVQGAAAAGPGVGRDLLGCQPDPADQQVGVRRPPVRTVVGHRDLRAVHVDRLGPGVGGDAGQQPPQRGDAFGADRERDGLVVGGAGQCSGEVAGVGAQRDMFAAHPPG